MIRQWEELSKEDGVAFLNAVRDEDFKVLFEPSLCDFYRHPLTFFDGYDLIRVANKYSPPFMLLDYLSNGENHYYINGTDHAFQTLCTKAALCLSEKNVLSYIDLYFSYVYERGNTFVFLGQKAYETARVSKKDDFYIIETPIIYQEQERSAVIHVYVNGHIEVISPVNVSFLNAPKRHSDLNYIHPKEAEIVEQARAILEETHKGQEILAVADKENVSVRVIGNPNVQVVATNKPMVYLFVPAAQHTADYRQALTMAGGLFDCKQILGDYPRPSILEDIETYLAVNYDKNLKQWCEVLRIVLEFEEKGIEDATVAMRSLGLQRLYDGIKNEVSDREMFTIYLNSLEEQGFVRRD